MTVYLLNALGQQLLFQESDFGAPETVDAATIIVERVDSNSSPLTLTLRPITIGEYLASGRTGCQLDGEYNPAESMTIIGLYVYVFGLVEYKCFEV